MTHLPRAHSFLTADLSLKTIENMNLDEPRLSPQSVLNIDPRTQGLYLEREYRFVHRSRYVKTGQIAIMRCLGWGDKLGFVADLRQVYSPEMFTVLDIDEDSGSSDSESDAETHHLMPVEAYLHWELDDTSARRLRFEGNRDFFAAAATLRALVDAMPHRRAPLTFPSSRNDYYAGLAEHHEDAASIATLLTVV